ncbi:MAG: phosphatase PAP2 family protein [Bacteroidaceae bacterium]|nr:phosphatase PAP2 family protein [Bacteroidaceae bacterium]
MSVFPTNHKAARLSLRLGKLPLALLFILLSALSVGAQSLLSSGHRLNRQQRFILSLDSGFVMPQSPTYPVTFLSVPITVGIWVVRNEDRHFQRRMAAPAAGHRHAYEAPLSALPLAVNYGLKLAGVPSRHAWNRMLASQAAGGALAFAASNVIKNWASVTRPDGSSHHSFPSGHTTLAFASAAMLEEEYGHLSPFVSLGGYACASATAFLRINNNRHWLADVAEGFSIGTAAARAGYLLGDLFFRDRGTELEDVPFLYRNAQSRPSYVGYYSAARLMPGHYSLGQGRQLALKTGFATGAEAAWFPHRRLGAMMRLGVSHFFPLIDDCAQSFALQYLDAQLGPSLSWPMGRRWRTEAHALAGSHWLYGGKGRLHARSVRMDRLYSGSVGLSLDCRTKRNLSTRMTADYGLLFRHSTQSFIQLGITTAYGF